MSASAVMEGTRETSGLEGVAWTARVDWRVAVVAACVLGLALRLLLLDAKSIWLDEVLTIQAAEDGQAALWAGRSDRDHPPLYFGIMERAAYVGDSPFALRLPAALAGTLCVPLAYALARRLFGRAVGVTAAWLVALSPLLVWYSQETRSYSALACFGLVAMTGFAHMLLAERMAARLAGWALFVVGSAAALYTHYAAALLLPAQAVLSVAFLATKRANLGGLVWAVAGWAVAVGAFVPWLRSAAMANFLARLQDDRTYYARAAERITSLSLSALFAPMSAAALLVAAAALAALYLLLQRGHERIGALRENRWAQAAALIGFALALAISVYPRGHSIKRQLLILWPYVIVLMAWWWPWQAEYRRGLALALGMSLAATLLMIAGVPKDEWREVTAYVTLNAAEGDALATLPNYQSIPFEYYNRGRVAVVTLAAGSVAEELEQARAEHGRLWVAFHTTDRSGPNAEVEGWLKNHGTLEERRSFYHIDLRLYALNNP